MEAATLDNWTNAIIKEEEVRRYLQRGADFIDDAGIENVLVENRSPDPAGIRDILSRALSVQRLDPPDTAALLNVED